VDTVRATGGNNQYRTLIVTTHSASIDETAVKALKVPNDDRVIVSIHYYSPYDFAGNESSVSTWGTDEDKSNLDEGFKLLNDTFVSKGIPVIIGEFGAVDKGNDSTRATYYEYYTKSAKKYGITCFIWDNGGDYNLFDRTNLTWYNNDLVSALMKGVE
jgi:endoglucanase